MVLDDCLVFRKAMASSCAGLRVLRRSSNSCITPYAGSCKDCKKVKRSESLTGQGDSEFYRGKTWGVGYY